MVQSAFAFNFYADSDIGLVRSNNEDAFACQSDQSFFTVADGMGGHRAGEVASQEATRFVCLSMEDFLSRAQQPLTLTELTAFSNDNLKNANDWVYQLSKNYEPYRGMGTTLSTLLFHHHFLIATHVGDSRIYRFRNDQLRLLTHDHSLQQGQDSTRHILTQAIGTPLKINPDTTVASVKPYDLYLMCSDGLTDQLDEGLIKTILAHQGGLRMTVSQLIQAAHDRGGKDNITVILIEVTPP